MQTIDDDAPRFLSKQACEALAARITAKATGGGQTYVGTFSTWYGNLRWARNRITTGGDVENTTATITRTIFGAGGNAVTNALDDATLKATIEEAERLRLWYPQWPEMYPVAFDDKGFAENPISSPKIWFDSSYQLTDEARAKILEPIVAQAAKAGLLSAGYMQVGAEGYSVVRDAFGARSLYYPMTSAQFSVTVRDPRGTGSGWAGVDFADWNRIDPLALFHNALDKCKRSQNPVRVEPGRYTAILEPQAVCDLFEHVMYSISREGAESGDGPFASARKGFSKIGERVFDDRITVSADPMDPDLGFVPFDWAGEPYLNTKWVENGVLKELAYSRGYGITKLQKDQALPSNYAFRISGGTTSIDEMIATTERGVIVTRFHNITLLDLNSLLLTGVTRDGLWLVEHGKITKAIKNFRFTESPFFVLNNVEQLGVPQRVFHPSAPSVCPPIKARDFSFTGLMDAV